MSENIHVYPVADVLEHVTTGLDCWCEPHFQLPCDECGDGCWKCTDGAHLLSREEAEHADRPIVIVHNERAP
jgi:hypothetical protein